MTCSTTLTVYVYVCISVHVYVYIYACTGNDFNYLSLHCSIMDGIDFLFLVFGTLKM